MSRNKDRHIIIDVAAQRLSLYQGGEMLHAWPVSTAENGVGQRNGSECTPLGAHHVRLKIGDGCAPNSVFVARRPTGEVFSTSLAKADPGRDWILTRIIWLSGTEPGLNRGGDCDTLRRFIYIHGCPDQAPMGRPRSHGCIRMRNNDVIELFDQIDNGCPVHILDSPEDH